MKIILIVLASAIGGCVSARPAQLPGGARGYGRQLQPQSGCKQRNGYEIVGETASLNFLEPVYTVTFRCP